MKTTTCLTALMAVCGSIFTTTLASAHISVAGPAFAKSTWEASFTVGHGCDGADTYSVKLDIPAGVTSVRAVDSTLGKAVTEKDASGNVKSVTWTKLVADVLPHDDNFYRLPVRMALPDAPFTTLYFVAHQVCRNAVGDVTTVEWNGMGQTTALPDGAPPPEPAPSVVLLPARTPGWNKYTVAQKVSDLKIFNDAEIVWAGDAAYSVNPAYTTLIATEPGTTKLTEILAGTEIWVKY
jgi:uncharacterized protein YcnI